MRIKGDENINKHKNFPWWILLSISAVILLLFLYYNRHFQHGDAFFLDMESLSLDQKKFISNGKEFGGGHLRSDIKAFKGKFSARCDNQNIYGPGLTLDNVSSGDIIDVKIWQQTDEGHGGLIFQALWPGYYKTKSKADRIEGGWELVRLRDTIPPGVYKRQLKIYPAIRENGGVVYFDNLEVDHIKNKNAKPPTSANFDAPEINIRLEDKQLKKLKLKRSEAFDQGNLDVGKADLVPGKLEEGEENMNIMLRLKGDLLDHLQGKRWSFRIVPEEGKAWRGMTEFSIQNTKSRNHLSEWIFHKMLEDEGVLTTKYDFVKFNLNGEFIGIYAYEEHFNNALLYKQQREPGPIYRLNEDALWEFSSKGLLGKMSLFESAHIEAFGGSSALKDADFKEKFIKGQTLLYNYLQGKFKVGDYIDMDQMAKFAAIMDVCMAYHGFGATNQRFYYNAVSGKLEPLGYDGFSPDGVKWYPPPMILGEHINTRISKDVYFHKVIQPFHYFLFNDYEFVELYIQYLEKFTKEDYVKGFLEKYSAEIDSRAAFINQTYTSYDFKPDLSFKNPPRIQQIIHPSDNASIKAYRNEDGSLSVENYHLLPIEILGFGNDAMEQKVDKTTILESKNQMTPIRRYSINPKGKFKYLFCKTLGASQIKRFSIFNWTIPNKLISTTKASLDPLLANPLILIDDEKVVRLSPKLKTLNDDLIIPEGYSLRIPSGASIELGEGVSIVSYGPVFMEGNALNPIEISSSSRGQGLLILDAKEESRFSHCTFKNLKARNKGSQIAEGGLSFYNTKVSFSNCKFENSKAKDAINFIKTNYSFQECTFKNINGDGIDANNSIGELKTLSFDNVGKDALEVSGGALTMESIIIDNANSNGLNVSRNAKVNVVNLLSIRNSKHGVAASDLADLRIENINLENVEKGFLLFQKLASYGSAKVEVKSYETKQVDKLHVIDQNAILVLNNQTMKAN